MLGERVGERHTVVDLLAHRREDLPEALVRRPFLDHFERFGDRDARAHERGHLPREVHDLLLRDALRRELELVEALLLLDLLHLEVAHQQLVAERVLAGRLECVLDLGAVGTDGDVAIGGHGRCSSAGYSTYTVRRTSATVLSFSVTSRMAWSRNVVMPCSIASARSCACGASVTISSFIWSVTDKTS